MAEVLAFIRRSIERRIGATKGFRSLYARRRSEMRRVDEYSKVPKLVKEGG
jgi:hypothetical protein